MKNNTNSKKIKRKTVSYESAMAFCHKKIVTDVNEIGLEVHPSHSDVKTSDLVTIFMMYRDLYINRYESHLEAITLLSNEHKPLNYKNMKQYIDEFDMKDFVLYLEYQKICDELPF